MTAWSTGGGPYPPRLAGDAHDQSRVFMAGRDLYVTPLDGPVVRPLALSRTLPRDVAGFTGRTRELERLLTADQSDAGVAIHTIDGMPGVGKTALATHAAHLLADRFPDGQLFVRLHAHTPGQRPTDPARALATLLVLSGVPAQALPADLETRAALWRERLVDRNVLLVLDDATDQRQVEPLLPASPGCRVLITSRRRLIALEGAQPLPLDVLSPHTAAQLFVRLAGCDPTETEGTAVAEVVHRCGQLPLAIALLAGRLAHHPSWTLAQLAADITAAQDRLAELDVGDRAVAAAFDLSYRDLPADRRRLFRRLGLHLGPDLDAHAVAALEDIPLPQARRHLEELYTDHLIEEHVPGRYRLHDLLGDYARVLAAGDPPEERERAIGRLLDYYQYTAHLADRHVAHLARPGRVPPPGYPGATPQLTTSRQALSWLRTALPTLLACSEHALAHAQYSRVISLAASLDDFLHHEGQAEQSDALQRGALLAAQRGGDRLGEANALWSLGRVWLVDDHPMSVESLERALSLYRELGDQLGEANTLWCLGHARSAAGGGAAAVELLERALRLYGELEYRRGEAYSLALLGHTRLLMGEHTAADGLLRRALTRCRELDDHFGEANTLWCLGQARVHAGDGAAAVELLERALALYGAFDYRHGEAYTWSLLGEAWALMGEHTRAADQLERALRAFRDFGDKYSEVRVLNSMGALRADSVGPQEGLTWYRQALQRARRVHNRPEEARALEGIARCKACVGEQEAAAVDLRQAVAIYQDLDAPRTRSAAAALAQLAGGGPDTERTVPAAESTETTNASGAATP